MAQQPKTKPIPLEALVSHVQGGAPSTKRPPALADKQYHNRRAVPHCSHCSLVPSSQCPPLHRLYSKLRDDLCLRQTVAHFPMTKKMNDRFELPQLTGGGAKKKAYKSNCGRHLVTTLSFIWFALISYSLLYTWMDSFVPCLLPHLSFLSISPWPSLLQILCSFSQCVDRKWSIFWVQAHQNSVYCPNLRELA